MHAGVARESFQRFCVFEQLFRLRFGRDRALQLRILFRRRIERDVQLVRNHPRDPIGVAIWQAHHPPNIAHHAFRFQFSKSDDLSDAPLAILLPDVFKNFAATRFTKIDIDIRRRYAVRIKKSLENQSELEWIDVSDPENVGDERSGGRSAPRANRNSATFGEMNEIPND